MLVDLDDFAPFNRNHGHAEGDRVLQAVSQLLLLNLRHCDLLCRLAGDRFVALLPGTGEAQAWRIAGELENAVRYYAHKSVPQGEPRPQRHCGGLHGARRIVGQPAGAAEPVHGERQVTAAPGPQRLRPVAWRPR